MTRFQDKRFSVYPGDSSQKYRDNWERTFGSPEQRRPEATCVHPSLRDYGGFVGCTECGQSVMAEERRTGEATCVVCNGEIPDDGGYCHVGHPGRRFCRKSCLRTWISRERAQQETSAVEATGAGGRDTARSEADSSRGKKEGAAADAPPATPRAQPARASGPSASGVRTAQGATRRCLGRARRARNG